MGGRGGPIEKERYKATRRAEMEKRESDLGFRLFLSSLHLES